MWRTTNKRTNQKDYCSFACCFQTDSFVFVVAAIVAYLSTTAALLSTHFHRHTKDHWVREKAAVVAAADDVVADVVVDAVVVDCAFEKTTRIHRVAQVSDEDRNVVYSYP
jgi:hypothetical protein